MNASRSGRLDLDRRALALLHEVLRLDPGHRRSFIERRCGRDPRLREEMMQLLAEASATHDDFLEASPAHLWVSDGVGVERAEQKMDTDDRPPEIVGDYRVVKLLGRGGMGSVWLGAQEHPVQRQVALKLVRPLGGLSARRRFAIECQALAKLSHPNVATLHEVGETDDGRPFIAMDLVEGQSIDDYCRLGRLGLRARIELCLQVCAAVRHAHQKGILHRDLKPSNVLVTEHDGRPLVKVIDFGIAQVFDDPILSGASPDGGMIVGSPAYMSPEAARGGAGMDTRSDVYSMGLLFYFLLAGVLPFELETQTVFQLRQRTSGLELPAPSERLRGLGPSKRACIAAERGVDEKALERRLQGDLDAIIGRAIAFDPDMRYSSPSDLAADLERHLASRPVSARAATWPYVFGRLLRRHVVAAVALSALILTLGAGVVVSTREARRANLEAERSRQFSSFLVELFTLSDPDRDAGRAADARALLDRGADRLAEELGGQPLDRARLAHAISEVYQRLGLHERAESLAIEALELRRAELSDDHEELLQSLAHLGLIRRQQRRFEESEVLLLQVLEERQATSERRPLALAAALNDLGNLEWSRDDNQAALDYHRRALEIRERELGPFDERLARSLNNMGAILQGLGRYAEAAESLRRADTIFVRNLGENHPIRAAGLNNLGMSLLRLNRWAEAEASFRQALAIWSVSHGETHQRTLNAKSNLARLLTLSGRWGELREILDEVIPALEAQPGKPHNSLAYNLERSGLASRAAGDLEAAYDAFERARDIYLARMTESKAVRVRLYLAEVTADLGRPQEAADDALAVLEEILAYDDENLNQEAGARRMLGKILIDLGRTDEAREHLLRALEADEMAPGFFSDRAPTHRALGDLAAQGGRLAEARRHYLLSAEIYRQEYPPTHPALAAVERRLSEL